MVKNSLVRFFILAYLCHYSYGFGGNLETILRSKNESISRTTSIEKLPHKTNDRLADQPTRHHPLHALSPTLEAAGFMYRSSMVAFPMATKLATGGVLALLGDAIAQFSQKKTYDEKSATSIVIFDIFYRSLQCFLFPLLVRICKGQHFGKIFRNASANSLAAWEQTLVNQLLVIPLIYYPSFFMITGYVQSLSTKEVIEHASKKILMLLKRNWTFWIPVQYVQFRFVVEQYQIPFLCIVGLFWTFILSTCAGSSCNKQVLNVGISNNI